MPNAFGRKSLSIASEISTVSSKPHRIVQIAGKISPAKAQRRKENLGNAAALCVFAPLREKISPVWLTTDGDAQRADVAAAVKGA
jgi:hypothetical protein